MPYSPATSVLQFLRHLIAVRDADGTSDGELVARFARKHDEAAFAELLRRHGPMVLGVCRRVLGNSADADDAFQAAFLVLVRKAGSLRAPGSVANWLHGVAHRTALKERGEAAKRQQREREAASMLVTQPSEELVWRDLRPVLDEEIARLPARYRAAFVLCHLEGKTNEEAARQLGCPTGTILSRLARARERLRARLTKRGVTLSTAALAAVVTERTASAAVPAALAQTTLQAATALATGGAVAANLLTLTEGVIHAMFAAKVKFAAAVLLLGVILIAGAGSYSYGKLTAQDAASSEPTQAGAGSTPSKGSQTRKDDFEERRAAIELQRKLMPLMEKRLAAIKEQMQARAEELLAGRTTVDVLLEASHNLLKAQQEMSAKPADQLKMLEMQFARTKLFQEILETRWRNGRVSIGEVSQTRYYRYDAEIALERLKAKLGKDGAKGEITKELFEGTEIKQP